MTNQNPEQIARDNIDKQLTACGWLIQDKKTINLAAAQGVAVREYSTEVGPADYVEIRFSFLDINRIQVIGLFHGKQQKRKMFL